MSTEEFQKKFGIIGRSKEMRDLTDIVQQVANSDISVLLYGESGVGKEVFARAIHGFSNRAEKNLVSVNCGAIPEGILESELFGHKKGSFTGAVESRKGFFEIADGGTLFLDEIAEMPITTQVKLLRAIETKEFMKVGAETSTNVDIRIIAATNKNLQTEVDARRFREDLYFRLKAVTLHIPPLRKRKQDIDELIDFFIAQFSQGKGIEITNDARDFLRNYAWPGNIRELRNTLETAIALNRSEVLDIQLFEKLLKIDTTPENKLLPATVSQPANEFEKEFIYRALFELKKDILELKDIITDDLKERRINHDNGRRPPEYNLNEMEKKTIISALERTGGNRKLSAKLLGLSERTLYRKMNSHNILDYEVKIENEPGS